MLGGNGGLIETSGKAFLDVTGIRVDASASNGRAGLWSLDPENTDVDNFPTAGGSFSGLNPNVFTPAADNAMVNIADIQFSLNNGTDVTITTVGSGGTQLGDHHPLLETIDKEVKAAHLSRGWCLRVLLRFDARAMHLSEGSKAGQVGSDHTLADLAVANL